MGPEHRLSMSNACQMEDAKALIIQVVCIQYMVYGMRMHKKGEQQHENLILFVFAVR